MRKFPYIQAKKEVKDAHGNVIRVKWYLIGPYQNEYDSRAQNKIAKLESDGTVWDWIYINTASRAKATRQFKEGRIGKEGEGLDEVTMNVKHEKSLLGEKKEWE